MRSGHRTILSRFLWSSESTGDGSVDDFLPARRRRRGRSTWSSKVAAGALDPLPPGCSSSQRFCSGCTAVTKYTTLLAIKNSSAYLLCCDSYLHYHRHLQSSSSSIVPTHTKYLESLYLLQRCCFFAHNVPLKTRRSPTYFSFFFSFFLLLLLLVCCCSSSPPQPPPPSSSSLHPTIS